MELLEEIKSTLENQSREQKIGLRASDTRYYINASLRWDVTIEGFLFWGILHYSYFYHGTYDYISLVKLYHIFGRDVFKYDISMSVYYRDYFDKGGNCLSDEGFGLLCKEFKRYGLIRRD